MNKTNIILLLMLLFAPISITAQSLHLNPLIIFITSGLAIIPLAAFIASSTEAIASVVGSTLGGLLNATFGNGFFRTYRAKLLIKANNFALKSRLTGSYSLNFNDLD